MAVGSSLILLVPWLSRTSSRNYPLYAMAFFALSRIGLWIVISVVLGYAAGCDKAHWLRHMESATFGLLPYVDYASEYGPLFSYLLAPAFLVFGAQAGPLVTFVLFDFLTFVMLHKVQEAPGIARYAAMLYMVTPVSWFNVVRYGQDESVGAFFLVLMLLALRQERHNLLGVLAGIGTLITKVLFLLFAVPMLLKGTRRVRSCLIGAAIILGGYLPIALLGGDILSWLPRGVHRGGPVIWTVVARWFHPDFFIPVLVLAGVLLSFTLVIVFRGRRLTVTDAVLLLYAAFMLASPKAWSTYALLVLPVLCLKIARSERLRWHVWFAAYSFTMVFYHFCFGALDLAPTWSTIWIAALATLVAATAFHAHILIDALKSMSKKAAGESL
jgi:hypothetical protein